MRRNCWDRIQFGQSGATGAKEREGPDKCQDNNRRTECKSHQTRKDIQNHRHCSKIIENSFPSKISNRKTLENPIQSDEMREREKDRGAKQHLYIQLNMCQKDMTTKTCIT